MTEIDYPYMRAFGKMIGWSTIYLNQMLKQAKKDKAPQTALHKRATGTWCTLEECNMDVKRAIRHIMKGN